MADTLHASYLALNIAAIDEFIEHRQPESLYLEFKTLTEPEPDLKRLAEMISGFANSAGGIIIWGVATERSSGRDVANKRRPIPDVDKLIPRLELFARMAVSPQLEGIEHRVLEHDTSGAGLAATFVPESVAGPHMALEQKRYFKRSETDFYPMQHYDIADMFGVRQRPALRVVRQTIARSASGYDDRADDSYANVSIGVALVNEGRASAIAAYVRLRVELPFGVNPAGVTSREFGSSVRMVTENGAPTSVSMIGSPDFILHPKVAVPIATLEARTVGKQQVPACVIAYSTAAMNSPLEDGSLIVAPLEIAAVLGRTVHGL
jgi:hypothetical protein